MRWAQKKTRLVNIDLFNMIQSQSQSQSQRHSHIQSHSCSQSHSHSQSHSCRSSWNLQGIHQSSCPGNSCPASSCCCPSPCRTNPECPSCNFRGKFQGTRPLAPEGDSSSLSNKSRRIRVLSDPSSSQCCTRSHFRCNPWYWGRNRSLQNLTQNQRRSAGLQGVAVQSGSQELDAMRGQQREEWEEQKTFFSLIWFQAEETPCRILISSRTSFSLIQFQEEPRTDFI